MSETNGLRLVSLDSLVPGESGGALDDGQLTWLRGLLAERAPAGTV